MSDEPALRPDLVVGEALSGRCPRHPRRSACRHRGPGQAGFQGGPRFPPADEALAGIVAAARAVSGRGWHPAAHAGARSRPRARRRARRAVGARCAHGSRTSRAGASPRSLATLRARIEHIRQSRGDRRPHRRHAPCHRRGARRRRGARSNAGRCRRLSFAQIAERLARGYRSARTRACRRYWPQAGAEELHELRKRVVNHRYQFEIVAAAVAALHQDVGWRSATAARAARQASGPAGARAPDRRRTSRWRLGARGLTPAIEQRMAAHVATSAADRRAPVPGKAEGFPAPARGHVAERRLTRVSDASPIAASALR